MQDTRQVGMVALALSLVAATAIAAGTWKSVRGKPADRKIRITGSAKKRIKSDLIEWSATGDAHAADRTAAYKQLKAGVERTVAVLKKPGINAEESEPQRAK